MQDCIELIQREIREEEKILLLKAKGQVVSEIANEKLRIIALFVCGKYKRYFPIDTLCQTEEGVTAFTLERQISLSDIFFGFSKEEGPDQVHLSFCYCDAAGEWHNFASEIEMDSSLFVKVDIRSSWIGHIGKKVLYVLMTCLLPLWILDGFLAVKGIRHSKYIDEEIKGKKGIFYHAHGLVKHYTGYGYSLREIKTNYFVRCYEKHCKRCKETGKILFLSEREPDVGGNLDLIRKGVQKGGMAYNEFIDVRPIQKLPFSEIQKAAVLAAEAKVIVLEDFYPQIHALTLRKETKLIQLWHACGAFKMFGLSEVDKIPHLTQSTRNHRSYSMIPVSGTKMVPFYSEAFGVTPECVYPIGVPRTDIFFDTGYQKEVTERLYKKYPKLAEKRIVLFAPTFRGSGKTRAYYPKEMFDVNAFIAAMPEDVVLIVKHHPFVAEPLLCDERYADRVFDFTGKENINDLLFITSLLITDYSSSIFEAALLKIPMLFYVFDLEDYMRQRDIYFDFASFAPGEKVMEQSKLITMTSQMLETNESSKEDVARLQSFCAYFLDALDGNSTKRILDFIMDLEKMPNS